MKGLLIYDKNGAMRNRWFIQRLSESFNELGIDLQTAITDCDDVKILENIDFVIVRTISPEINKFYEENGVRVFNNYKTSFIANDKWQTFKACEKLGIPVMPTQLANENLLIEYPCVAKTRSGHGGTEIFWISNKEELNKIIKRFGEYKIILQKPCSELGKDMRVYVMGNKIFANVLRINKHDFRSNYSLGGQIEKSVLCNSQIKIIDKICDYLKSDYIGVDFIYDNGKWVLNEIEDSAGARMLYKLTDIDVAQKYTEYIKSVL